MLWRRHYRINRLSRQRSVQQVTNRPDAIRDAERHGWRGAQSLVNGGQAADSPLMMLSRFIGRFGEGNSCIGSQPGSA